ncbi:radical SAM protein [Micromonospora sp. NPDC049523]|uniref:radical SAM protein n=1 Tax=Micromonospora sp. NPDC049523 TaxID=3155921 RepID=UPI0034150EFB
MNAAADPKPDEELRFLRASVANRCNLNCVYCPKASGMENFVPTQHRNHRLTAEQYCRNLEHIAATGAIKGISFTGGEPTLNADLPTIVAHARTLFDRVEMTTNGKFLQRRIDQLAPHLDVLKVSMDAVDPALAHDIVRGRGDDHGVAARAITMALDAGITVGINVVAMRRNANQIDGILALARKLGAGRSGRLYVSILDLYYTDETHDLWVDEFMPLGDLERELRGRSGGGDHQDRKGCDIGWFDVDDMQVRVKNSHSSTYRGARCEKCPVYCQEGLYGLKHSVEGWVTPCPTGQETFGVHLEPDLDQDEAMARLRPLVDELLGTYRVEDSFAQFLDRRGLSPQARKTLPLIGIGIGTNQAAGV